MGFSVTGASAILLVGLWFYAGTFLSSFLTAEQEVNEARGRAENRIAAARQGDLRIDNATHDGATQTLVINATNTGAVTFNLDDLDLLIDGVPRNSDITDQLVEDEPMGIWPPQTRLELTVTAADPPEAIVLVMRNGALAFWRA